MLKTFSNLSVEHLSIDVDSLMLIRLPADIRRELPLAEREFSDAIKPEVSTTWVGLGKAFQLYAHSMTESGEDRAMMIRGQHHLAIRTARDDEDIFIKLTCDALEGGILGNHLHQKKRDTLLYTGLFSEACVPVSVTGGIREGFRCIVVPDLMADMDYRVSPKKREEIIRGHVSLYYPDEAKEIEFITSHQVVDILKRDRAAAHRL